MLVAAKWQHKLITLSGWVLALVLLAFTWQFVLFISVLTGILGVVGLLTLYLAIVLCEVGLRQFYNPKEERSLPGSITLDQNGYLYFASPAKHCILKFDSRGKLLARLGRQGDEDGMFRFPTGVAVDRQGHLYVTDLGNYRIQKLDNQGRCLAKWEGAAQLHRPDRIALDENGFLYASDISKHCILKFDSDLNLLAKWGGEGQGRGQFRYPGHLALDLSGRLYVADTLNGRIQSLDNAGKYLAELVGSEQGRNQFLSDEQPAAYPGGLAIDRQGHIYVMTTWGLQKFERDSRAVSDWPIQDFGVGSARPRSLALDVQGRIYILLGSCTEQQIARYDLASGRRLNRWRINRRFV